MRIMHISTRLILGGSQENTVLSCEGQLARGHDVALVHGPIHGPEGSLHHRARDFRADDGRTIQLVETPHLVRELAPRRDLRALRDLRRLIRDLRPDLVHTHSSKAGILGRFAAWRERVPGVVHTIHGLPFHPYETRRRNALYVAAERAAAKRCHAIVCVAEAMRDQALARGIGRPEQYAVVRSGMEIDRYLHPAVGRDDMRVRLGLGENDFVVGTVARLAELKGHDDLLDVLPDLLRRVPRARYLWVGDGWLRPQLQDRLARENLADRVTITGLVPSEEVPNFIQAMDVLAHPSYREGLPRTVPQALLGGVPPVAYDVDGTREACVDGETGRLVPPGDRPALLDALQWMAEHPDERRAMVRRGRERCRQRFSVPVMIEALERVYEAVLAGRPPASDLPPPDAPASPRPEPRAVP